MPIDPRLAHLGHTYGIATQFWDWKGQYREPDEATILACLRALDVDTESDDWLNRAFVEADERIWLQPLPECIVAHHNQERYIDVHVQANRPANVWVRLEDGSTNTLDQVDNWDDDRLIRDEWIGRATFRLPTWVQPGYHTIFLESDDHFWESPFIVTPTTVPIPDADSLWGFMVQLYSVCSRTSWGIGDFVDLADLALWAKSHHDADFILINPTHAGEATAPMNPSPYFPSTRRYINPIYIRPESIQEYATASDEVRSTIQTHRDHAYSTTKTEEIQRDMIWREKRAALALLFSTDRPPSRQTEFEAFVEGEGESLRRYSTWCVLTDIYGQDWTEWPPEFQNPDSANVDELMASHGQAVTFHMWMQWIADLQAKYAHTAAKNAGMKIGIMSDLAVGVNSVGEETWAAPDLFAKGVTVGAPPDAYTQAGQNWCQPPWRPDRLAKAAYLPLRTMISSMLGRCGAVRIDHIIGQFRLWWVPEGMEPSQGAYVRYDHEAMVGILALEAERAGAVVIGEDLGTVEPWVREYLAQSGILGTSILWFENDDEKVPLDPEQWRNLCLASVTTHDLPPTRGYLEHSHVELRYRLGLFTESLDDEIARDAVEQAGVRRLLVDRGLIAEGESDEQKIVEALHRFLCQTPAKLKCVALTDAVGERRTQNQPGTVDEYPNWRIPLADESGKRLSLEEVFEMTSIDKISNIMNGRL